MPDPISITSVSVQPAEATHSPNAPKTPEVSFKEVLTAPSHPSTNPMVNALKSAAKSIGRGEKMVDRAIRSASRAEVSPQRLLALQAGVYRYTQELELASKLVDKATSAVKQTLQSQQ